MLKEENYCSNKILTWNNLASKFTLTEIPTQARKVACLIFLINFLRNMFSDYFEPTNIIQTYTVTTVMIL